MSRKKRVIRLSVSESSCGRSGFCEVVFLRSFFGLELRMRKLKRHEGCHFSSGVEAWAPELHMATALDKSTHFLAAFLFVATNKASEKLNKCAKPKWNKLRLGQANMTK